MKFLRPRTFLNLVVFGFVAVSLPLGVGLWTTLTYIQKVTGTGLEVVDHAVSGTRDGALLTEYLRNEERILRLFAITHDREYIKRAEDYHGKTDSLLFELAKLPLAPQVLKNIEEMRGKRNIQRAVLISIKNGVSNANKPSVINGVVDSFESQYKNAELVRSGIREMTRDDVSGLKKTMVEAQRALISQTVAFILATILMIAVMAFLLSWPIRQLNKSVERLGNGDFRSPIMVSGPLDVEAVGRKLDWLRIRLYELEQEKAKFLAHISHELKTPLASIREGAALLSEGLVGELNDKQRSVAVILVNNSVVLQELIENIINFNMAQAGAKTEEKIQIDLAELIEKVAATQQNRLLGRNIKLDLKLQKTEIWGYQKELLTVFENLFSNAVKFCPRDGYIGCRLTSDKRRAACIIYDTGPGIPLEEGERIFHPFYQVAETAHSVVKGSGLGLAIVRECLRHHNGSIRLLNPGEPGARFGIMLPVQDEDGKQKKK